MIVERYELSSQVDCGGIDDGIGHGQFVTSAEFRALDGEHFVKGDDHFSECEGIEDIRQSLSVFQGKDFPDLVNHDGRNDEEIALEIRRN